MIPHLMNIQLNTHMSDLKSFEKETGTKLLSYEDEEGCWGWNFSSWTTSDEFFRLRFSSVFGCFGGAIRDTFWWSERFKK